MFKLKSTCCLGWAKIEGEHQFTFYWLTHAEHWVHKLSVFIIRIYTTRSVYVHITFFSLRKSHDRRYLTEILTTQRQCWITVGPASTPLAQQWSNIGWIYPVCWIKVRSHGGFSTVHLTFYSVVFDSQSTDQLQCDSSVQKYSAR